MPPRFRLLLLWGLFLLAAVVAGIAVHRLHRTVQQEILEQQKQAMMRAHELALDRIDQQATETRLAIVTELAGLHEDGLATSLQRWNVANELVVETFVWDAARGFNATPAQPAVAYAQLPALWQEFREWRAKHPAAQVRDQALVAGVYTWAVRTLDNPALPAFTLRYQAENLDLIADAGGEVDPWAGWAAHLATAGAPWIVWYQPGPDASVRGCIVDPAPLVAKLQAEIAGGDVVHVTVTRQPGQSAGAVLSGYQLALGSGEMFKQKAAEARLTAGAALLLLGLFLLGGAALTLYSRREARDAGRKITFVTQVSHELRTPLTSIRMFADLLAAPGLGEEKRLKFAGMIGAESSRLSALVERLLAFNALDRAGRPVPCGPVDVGSVVREVLEEMKLTLGEAGLQPAVMLPPAPAVALGDHSTLKQALLNLLDNACKYARGSGPLAITVAPAGGQVVLRVTDRGAGIPADVRSRLFEPFVQGGGSLTTKSPGVGLGLSLARGLLRQTGADLELMPGELGASFEIRLPAAPVNSAAPP